jgi:O-acetyl-ADP-ribose deacetylase (regulator of RNase III)
MHAKTYQVNRSTITLRLGDICASSADVLVSSDDFSLSMGGGVSMALREAAGAQIFQDAAKLIPARAGDVVVTSAGKLRAKYLFHAVTIGSWDQDVPDGAIVRQATQRAMQLLALLGCRSIAFPALGAGVARIPLEVVASQMAAGLIGFLLDVTESYDVEVYLLDRYRRIEPEHLFGQFEDDIQRTLGLHLDARGNTLQAPTGNAPPSSEGNGGRRQQEIYEMLRHLDNRRNQAESALVRALTAAGGRPGQTLSELRRQLDEIRELRRGYESDLASLANPATSAPDVVFLSSTWTDLRPHREKLKELISRLGFRFIGMEEFNPSAEAPGVFIRRKVNDAGIYLGVFGMRYGTIDSGSGLSMTELEYRQAVASRKELHMFVMDDAAPITVEMVEKNPEAYLKLVAFKQHVLNSHVCALFTNLDDLVAKAERTLREVRERVRT